MFAMSPAVLIQDRRQIVVVANPLAVFAIERFQKSISNPILGGGQEVSDAR